MKQLDKVCLSLVLLASIALTWCEGSSTQNVLAPSYSSPGQGIPDSRAKFASNPEYHYYIKGYKDTTNSDANKGVNVVSDNANGAVTEHRAGIFDDVLAHPPIDGLIRAGAWRLEKPGQFYVESNRLPQSTGRVTYMFWLKVLEFPEAGKDSLLKRGAGGPDVCCNLYTINSNLEHVKSLLYCFVVFSR